ncbi:hypothetical protein M1N53_00610 [Thermodesulfovibrionales bacterium]|nr:hypothetical protein [Thermodesulfovibrionales bacterium]MCL0074645.1 hypothetical protein [Thermodesulfovibrionales bacterium]
MSVRGERGRLDGRAMDIDADGVLIVQKADGTLERVISGDILGETSN